MHPKIVTDLNYLRVPCESATLEEATAIGKQLEEVLKEVPCLGLAANQIGIQKQVCLIHVAKKEGLQHYLLCNPKIVNQYEEYIYEKEGCLSLPGQWCKTKRFRYVQVVDDFHPEGFVVFDEESVCVQHEVGHGKGEIFTDYAVSDLKVGRNDPCPICLKAGKTIKFKKCGEHYHA